MLVNLEKLRQVADERRQHELDGIFNALKTVCDTQCLPLAQTWALSGCSSYVAKSGVLQQSCSSFNSCCIGKACMSSANLPFYVRDLTMWGFHEACSERHLEKSRGVAGRSLSSHGTWFCADVTELHEDDYPLVSFARISGMISCLTIYLKSLEVNAEYVLEFFLPRLITNASSLQTLRETVRQQFKSASLMQLDIMSPPQVVGEVPLNWNLESPPSPVTLMTEKGEVEPASENMEKDNMENKPSNFALSVVSNMEKEIEDSTQRTDSHPSKRTNRKTKRSKSLITLDEIEKHFGKPMDEAATILKVSRSTLKRICRNLGIPRWPYRIGPDKSESLMKSDPADVAVHMSEGAPTPVFVASSEQLGNDPVTLTKIGKQPNPGDETKATNMIAKVTYDKSIIKFPFSLLDGGLVKFNEMIATRFHLKLGSFRLKYVDKDGDNILIANDNDLAAILDAFNHVDSKPVIRLFVQLVSDQSSDA